MLQRDMCGEEPLLISSITLEFNLNCKTQQVKNEKPAVSDVEG